MGNYQYKSGSTWTDVPDIAHPLDDGGGVNVVWPAAEARDGSGAPCGAIGLPRIEITSPWLPAAGWAWYTTFFATTTDLTVTLTGLTAWDARSGAWVKYTGALHRPQGSYNGRWYENVRIVVDQIATTT